MTEEIAHINKEFWDNFSSIYSDPIQTNNYLHRACSSVEDKIKRDFKLAGLHDNYSL